MRIPNACTHRYTYTDRHTGVWCYTCAAWVPAPFTEQEVIDASDLREAKRRIAADNSNRHALSDIEKELGQ